jgi:hypothetical protein
MLKNPRMGRGSWAKSFDNYALLGLGEDISLTTESPSTGLIDSVIGEKALVDA